jgi:positive regulator of sigma E activity
MMRSSLFVHCTLLATLCVAVISGIAISFSQPAVAAVISASAVNSYQIKFSFEKPDGKRKITTTVVQAKSTIEAQRQVKDIYFKVNIITIKRL